MKRSGSSPVIFVQRKTNPFSSLNRLLISCGFLDSGWLMTLYFAKNNQNARVLQPFSLWLPARKVVASSWVQEVCLGSFTHLDVFLFTGVASESDKQSNLCCSFIMKSYRSRILSDSTLKKWMELLFALDIKWERSLEKQDAEMFHQGHVSFLSTHQQFVLCWVTQGGQTDPKNIR